MKRVADRGSAVDRRRGGMTPRSMEHITRTAVQINCAVLICFSGLAMAQAGRLDATFGIGGTFVTHDTQSFDAVADAVALQRDGKIVVAGELNSLAGVLRLNTNGALDTSFGSGGAVTINVPSGLGGGVQVIGVAIQPDSKIVAGISTINSDGSESFSLARLVPNGSMDTTFGTAGIVSTFPSASNAARPFSHCNRMERFFWRVMASWRDMTPTVNWTQPLVRVDWLSSLLSP